jgi:hypothetical protein
MKPMLLLAAVVGLWPVAAAIAQGGTGDAGKPDLAKAQTIVNQVCAACHEGTASPTPANPSRGAARDSSPCSSLGGPASVPAPSCGGWRQRQL